MSVAILIPWLPALAAAIIAGIALNERLQKWAAAITTASIGAGFVITMVLWPQLGDKAVTLPFLDWMTFGGEDGVSFSFSYFLDPLAFVMLAVVTGVGCLISTYAAGYMKGDPGYWRFFTYVALFIFAMTTLVMADNLVLLFLGWEGVGACSYLLIGYYYDKPFAVAAAKKAFIVNRVGDFGFLLGIFLCYQAYDTVQISVMLEAARENLSHLGHGYTASTADLWIPFLLMIGAFGKSAQIPLYVWLPDAMAGPTPVSALVHAATMVTAGVYLIARCLPLFELSPYALPTVAIVGASTALFAATIALCCNDLKGVFAYSTVSQLGYMFLGLGVLSSASATFHLFTHAFFKALLFLTAGSVMHALAGQLDIRTMGGLRKKMPVTCWLMFVGCLSLAGFPFITSGFWSKDLILGDALAFAMDRSSTLYFIAVIFGVITAFLTAFYTFRLWFTVFTGEEKFEMGDEHHHAEEAHHEEHEDGAAGHDAHPDEPHEMPWLPMNAPLVLLAIGAVVLGYLGHHFHWFEHIIDHTLGAPAAGGHHGEAGGEHHGPGVFGMDPHKFMLVLSSILAVGGITLAAFFYRLNRPLTDKLAVSLAPIVKLLQNKYYIDEFYDLAFVRPLRRLGGMFYVIDAMIINNLIRLVAWAPMMVGRGIRPVQSGRLQGYGLGMVMGVAVFALLILIAAARG
ncbi:MAG: NADH-quinone oxidoreductase subunit L [Planctomycetota bacterium]